MRRETVWTVVAGTTAAVLLPGVACALTLGGSVAETAPGIAVQGDGPVLERPAEARPAAAPVAEIIAVSGQSPHEVQVGEAPSAELMWSADTATSAASPGTSHSAASAPSPRSPGSVG